VGISTNGSGGAVTKTVRVFWETDNWKLASDGAYFNYRLFGQDAEREKRITGTCDEGYTFESTRPTLTVTLLEPYWISDYTIDEGDDGITVFIESRESGRSNYQSGSLVCYF
jgi:hypothetical protein